jgi:hypothetical protein
MLMEDDYKGFRIHVVSGYSIDFDNYPFHVYVWLLTPDGWIDGPRESLLRNPGHSDQIDEAYAAGFDHARRDIDAR